MLPILLIHGYSTEGKDNTVEKIYGSLPQELKKCFGQDKVKSLNLSRWISLNNGILLDDVSYAMDRALRERFPELLESGFHVIIHSTGALVARNWLKKFSPKPSPIKKLIHLAGANFGSGLAHIGQGQASRWKNIIFQGTGVGTHILNELEFGSWKTIDLHCHFLQPGNDMYTDYQVQEFCIIGSQTLSFLRPVPIRYVKEDSSDNTVRTSAGNLNFNYVPVTPKAKTYRLNVNKLNSLTRKRLSNTKIKELFYDYDLSFLSSQRQTIPFAIAYETAHFGEDMGIVSGKKNRKAVMPLVKAALNTAQTDNAYDKAVERFDKATSTTFSRVAKMKKKLLEWDRQSQYEGHAQIIFRIKDQFGNGVEHFDVMFQSEGSQAHQVKLEKLLEDHHGNKNHKGTITFYFRTQKFVKETSTWRDLVSEVAPLDIEVSGHEPNSEDIAYVPLNIRLTNQQLQSILQSFKTTIIDITLVRLPSSHVFEIKQKK